MARTFPGVKGVFQKGPDIFGVLHISTATPHGPLRDQIDADCGCAARGGNGCGAVGSAAGHPVRAAKCQPRVSGANWGLVLSSQRNDRQARNWPGPKLAAQDFDCGALPLSPHGAALDMQCQPGHIVETRGPGNRQFNLHPFGYSLVRLEQSATA